jgi:hypothetical protein
MKRILFLILAFPLIARAAEVPKSPHFALIYPYAEAMIKKGRGDGYDQNFLRLLYTLSDLSGRPIYRNAADAELKLLLEKQSPIVHGPRPWMLWDRCFELSADQSKSLAPDGSSIRAFAAGWHHTKDPKFMQHIEVTLHELSFKKLTPIAYFSIAIDCSAAAARMPEPIAAKLRATAQTHDESFLTKPNPLGTDYWQAPANRLTSAGMAMLCLSRYENSGNVKFRDLVISAADAYRRNPPPPDADISPRTFGHVISLQLAAWRHASKQEYLDSARSYADIAVKKFWTAGNPLPNSLDGADSLVLSLLDLHLSILHITAVRCPPNTIDR